MATLHRPDTPGTATSATLARRRAARRQALGGTRLAPMVAFVMALVLALASANAAVAEAAAAAPQWRAFPFALKLDMALVRRVTGSAPGDLLATIASAGVDVLLVRSSKPAKPLNALLSGLPAAPASLLQQAGFVDTYEGRVVLRDAGCCHVARDTVLIRDTASTYTLLHEFVQSRLLPLHDAGDADTFELRFASDFRRLALYQRRLYDDAYRLLDPLWRRDILAAQAAVAGGLFRRIQIGQSQEAIVEKLLCTEIGVNSVYFDDARQQQGLCYGQVMIDNAIDMYNTVEESIAFVEQAARALRDDIRAGHIETGPRQQLSDEELLALEQATAATRRTLQPVHAELLALKQFYLR